MHKYIVDIPVYRLSHDDYSEKQNEYVKSHVPGYDPDISFENLHSEVEKEKIRDASYYFKAYGGAWRYNEIIGYIRIYKLGSQIRSEFWQTNAQKIVKTRKKQFIVKNRKLVPEFKIKDPTSNADIQQAMDLCIEKCRQKLKNRHLDLESYNLFSKHVNWVDLIHDV